MLPGKKFMATIGLLASVILISTTAMQQVKPANDAKFTNLKVLPKNITDKQLDAIMENWEQSLGVRCSFCHARNADTKKMDWAADTKPEKDMARTMFRMTQELNKKYFKAEKDSLGLIMEAAVNCNMCHNGNAHPEPKAPESHRNNGGPAKAPVATPTATPQG